MAETWRTKDRLGREVAFGRTSRKHILDSHADMLTFLDEVRLAIEQPDYVMRDADYPHRENHYRHLPASGRLVKVVVAYRPVPPLGAWEGQVISAHLAQKHKRKETLLWP